MKDLIETLYAIDDELAGHIIGVNATDKTLDRAIKKARRIIARALADSIPQMPGGTRRSKRSA